MKRPRKSRFISVEVGIRTDHECDAFVEWFQSQDNHVEKRSWTTHRWYVYFAPLPSRTAGETIARLCREIAEWPDEVRMQWKLAAEREFFVGHQIGMDPAPHMDGFDAETIRLAGAAGAGIRVAMYPPTAGERV